MNSVGCRLTLPLIYALKIDVYFSHCYVIYYNYANALSLINFDDMFNNSEAFLSPAPPFAIYWLNSLIPMTKFASSTNWVTFYDEFSVTKGPRAALGITLSRAAATYFYILNLFD